MHNINVLVEYFLPYLTFTWCVFLTFAGPLHSMGSNVFLEATVVLQQETDIWTTLQVIELPYFGMELTKLVFAAQITDH